MEADPYTVLGVPRNATSQQIKEAWARKVREHPPERDPLENQRINEARRLLLDAQARARLDTFLDHGHTLASLLEDLEQAEEAQNFGQAVDLCLQILKLIPGDLAMRSRYVHDLVQAGDLTRALEEARQLVYDAPNEAFFHWILANILAQIAENDPQMGPEAIREAQRAVELDPDHPDHHVLLGRLLALSNQFQAAERELEAALWTDKKLDVQDLDVLFQIAAVHIASGQSSKVKHDASRILDVVKDMGDELRTECASRLLQLLGDVSPQSNLSIAADVAEAALILEPGNTELAELIVPLKHAAAVQLELQRLFQDNTYPPGLKWVLCALGMAELEGKSWEERMEVVNKQQLTSADLDLLAIARTQYPAICQTSAAILALIEARVRQGAAAGRSPMAPPVPPSFGTPNPYSGGPPVIPQSIWTGAFLVLCLLIAVYVIGWAINTFVK